MGQGLVAGQGRADREAVGVTSMGYLLPRDTGQLDTSCSGNFTLDYLA